MGKQNKNIALYKNVDEQACKLENILYDVKILKQGNNNTENELKKENKTKVYLQKEEKQNKIKEKSLSTKIYKINFNECKIAAIEYKCIIFSKFIL